MSVPDLTLITALIVLVSAAVQSMTGFGFAVLAVPLLALVWHPVDAVALGMALSTVCVVLLWPQVLRAERVPIIRLLFLAALVGLPLGLWVLSHVDTRLLRLAIGAVTLVTVAVFGFNVIRVDRTLSVRTPHAALTIMTGFVAGVLTGALSMPGPPAVMLLTGSRVQKGAYRATLTAFAVLIYPLGLAAMILEALISPAAARQCLIQTPVVVVGILLGNWMHGFASERAFARLSLVLLGLSGALCLIRR